MPIPRMLAWIEADTERTYNREAITIATRDRAFDVTTIALVFGAIYVAVCTYMVGS
jgi:hypothetical protein